MTPPGPEAPGRTQPPVAERVARWAEATRGGDRGAIARALNELEADAVAPRGEPARDAERLAEALAEALAETPRPGGLVVGLTGPPGVGKSTLAGRLIEVWRGRGLTVGVIAVDPSSRRSGGALLGDRARMAVRPDDDGVFVRSMAARDRLGGLAPATEDAILVLRAAFDRVVVETVGVGQSETDVTRAADLSVVVVQPASGDTLQFLKAGLMEVPDLLVVNKADLGAVATAAARDLDAALALAPPPRPPVLLVSAEDLDAGDVRGLVDAVEAAGERLGPSLAALRRERLLGQRVDRFAWQYGALALQRLGGRAAAVEAIRRLARHGAQAGTGRALAALAELAARASGAPPRRDHHPAPAEGE